MDVKLTFMHRAATEYHQRVIADIKAAAKRAKVGVTDAAVNSLAFEASQQGSAVFSTLSFHEYLRFVDMGAGRGHPLGGLKTTLVALKSKNQSGKVFSKDNIRKPKKIYSKPAYGNITWLQNELLYGFTEETIAQLKSEMQAKV